MEKLLERVRKLLAIASPKSGASKNERDIAAREAGLLIAENGFVVVANETQASKIVEVAPHAWHLTQSLHYRGCGSCGGPISPTDIVWMRILPGLHQEWRCRRERCTRFQ